MAGRNTHQVTFTTSQTIAIPDGVTNLVSVVGIGQNGTPDSTVQRTVGVANVTYSTAGSGAGPTGNTWANLQGFLDGVASTVDDGGSQTFYTGLFQFYANNTETTTATGPITTNAISGTVSTVTSGGWHTTGPVTNSAIGSVRYDEFVAGTVGANTTGFGLTFNGGNKVPAVGSTVNNVAVTPGDSVSISVPPGGSLVVTYLQ
jgi:hypothetical protein